MAAKEARDRNRAVGSLDEHLPDRQMRDDVEWRELKAIFDEEMNKLPEKYRAVLVLCHLEGRSHQEVAEELGCSQGTLSSRLCRGRQLLARRLSAKGLVDSAVALVTFLSSGSASARLSYPLFSTTVRCAVRSAEHSGSVSGLLSSPSLSLAQRVMKTMIPPVAKKVSVVSLIVCFIGGGVIAGQQVLTGDPGQTVAAPTSAQPQTDLDDGSLTAQGGIEAAEERPQRGDPTKNKDQPKIAKNKGQPPFVQIQHALKQAMENGRSGTVQWTVPLHAIHEIPAVPRGPFAALSFFAPVNGGKVVPTNRRWTFKGTRRGKTKIVYEVHHQGKEKQRVKVIVEITVR